MSIDLKKFAGIVTALGILGGAVSWGLKSVFPTKEELAVAVVQSIVGHNSDINAHTDLIEKVVVPAAVRATITEWEKRERQRRRAELTDSEKVEVMVSFDGTATR